MEKGFTLIELLVCVDSSGFSGYRVTPGLSGEEDLNNLKCPDL